MELKKIYDTHELNKQKLIQEGFIKEKTTYQKTYPLKEKNFEVIFYLTEKRAKVKVYDKELKEEYLPFYVEEQTGEYVTKIKEEVENIWKEIVKNCFEVISIREKILDYVYKKYHTKPAYLWENDPISCTLKNENNKWYGIIMEIPYKTLGIEKLGKVPIINLKNTEEKVLDLIDNKEYFKAYHMNKKYWYTITLTKNINMKKLEKLIDESYNLVEKKKS